MGHPCCSDRLEGHCQIDLSHGRDRFCWKHSQQAQECAVVGCTNDAVPRFVTCADPIHRQWETSRRNRGAAYTMLKRTWKKAWRDHKCSAQDPPATTSSSTTTGDFHSNNTQPPSEITQPLSPNQPPPPPPPPAQPHVPDTAIFAERDSDSENEDEAEYQLPIALADHEVLKGQIYRRWSHNKQLVVSPCGIIKGRATFYGAEGQDGVVVCLVHGCYKFIFLLMIFYRNSSRLCSRHTTLALCLHIFSTTMHAKFSNFCKEETSTTITSTM